MTGLWVATLLCAAPLAAQETTVAWIGLYEPAMLEWLENACRESASSTERATSASDRST
jgi:hypothetical protein